MASNSPRGDVGVVVCDLAVEPSVVEPVDVAQGGELDVIEPLPWALGVDEFPLVEAVEALGHGVEAPICQDGSSSRRLEGLSGAVIGHDVLVDLSGQEPLEAPDDLSFS